MLGLPSPTGLPGETGRHVRLIAPFAGWPVPASPPPAAAQDRRRIGGSGSVQPQQVSAQISPAPSGTVDHPQSHGRIKCGSSMRTPSACTSATRILTLLTLRTCALRDRMTLAIQNKLPWPSSGCTGSGSSGTGSAGAGTGRPESHARTTEAVPMASGSPSLVLTWYVCTASDGPSTNANPGLTVAPGSRWAPWREDRQYRVAAHHAAKIPHPLAVGRCGVARRRGEDTST